MLKLIKIASLLLLSVASQAEVTPNFESILQLRADIQRYHQEGVKIRQQYNLADLDQLKACVNTYKPLREQAKATMDAARQVGSFTYRLDLVLAADAAFACLYCGGNGSACNTIPGDLQSLDEKLQAAGKLPE